MRGSGIAQTALNYTGQRLDGTGLLYYHARMYDPVLARFVSADSVVPGASAMAMGPDKTSNGPADPQQLNRFSYVSNNPVKNTDPTGHCSAGFSWGMVNGQCYQEALHQYMDPSRSVTDRAIGFIYAQADLALVSVTAVAVAPAVEAVGAAVATTIGPKLAEGISNWRLRTTEGSVVDKLNRYLLNPEHPIGGSKAKWFEQALGFTKGNLNSLAKQITFNEEQATPTVLTEFGQKYEQTISITGANGKAIEVPFIWIRNLDNVVRLVGVARIPKR